MYKRQDDDRGTPTPQKNEHHQDNEQHSVHNGFLQAVYRIQDVIGSIDNDLLAKTYGNRDYDTSTHKKEYRTYPVIEDIAYSMNCLLDMQDEGKLNKPLLLSLIHI